MSEPEQSEIDFPVDTEHPDYPPVEEHPGGGRANHPGTPSAGDEPEC